MAELSLLEYAVYGFVAYASFLMLILSVKDKVGGHPTTVAFLIPGMICFFVLAAMSPTVLVYEIETITDHAEYKPQTVTTVYGAGINGSDITYTRNVAGSALTTLTERWYSSPSVGGTQTQLNDTQIFIWDGWYAPGAYDPAFPTFPPFDPDSTRYQPPRPQFFLIDTGLFFPTDRAVHTETLTIPLQSEIWVIFHGMLGLVLIVYIVGRLLVLFVNPD